MGYGTPRTELDTMPFSREGAIYGYREQTDKLIDGECSDRGCYSIQSIVLSDTPNVTDHPKIRLERWVNAAVHRYHPQIGRTG